MPLMQIAARNTSGQRHSTASALYAPIEAPDVMISMSGDSQSARIAGTTSQRTYSRNWFSRYVRRPASPSCANSTRPLTLSQL